jgi:hypothetical protein
VSRDLRRKLLEAGWEERFSAGPRRLEEMAGLYRSLGYEVRVEDLAEVMDPGSCTSCFTVTGVEGAVGVLFTRPQDPAPGAEPGDPTGEARDEEGSEPQENVS